MIFSLKIWQHWRRANSYPQEGHLSANLNYKKIAAEFVLPSSGLYYKLILIVNDNSSIVSKWQASLIDDARVIIYNHKVFIIQATDESFCVELSYNDIQVPYYLS